jgi:hypothetical protein
MQYSHHKFYKPGPLRCPGCGTCGGKAGGSGGPIGVSEWGRTLRSVWGPSGVSWVVGFKYVHAKCPHTRFEEEVRTARAGQPHHFDNWEEG